MAVLMFIVRLLSFACGVSSTLLTTGSTVMINGIPYYLPGSPTAVLTTGSIPRNQQADLIPVTVVNSSDVTAATAGFGSDDVWQPDFLQGNFHFIVNLTWNRLTTCVKTQIKLELLGLIVPVCSFTA